MASSLLSAAPYLHHRMFATAATATSSSSRRRTDPHHSRFNLKTASNLILSLLVVSSLLVVHWCYMILTMFHHDPPFPQKKLLFVKSGPGRTMSNQSSVSAQAADSGSFSGQKYCYVHVGKSAGSKLSCELGFRYAPTCITGPGKTLQRSNSALVAHGGQYLHMFANECKPGTNVFLISIRNPIDRIISWYNYENLRQQWVHQYLESPRYKCLTRLQKWKEWDGCFETLDELATNCTAPTPSSKRNTSDEIEQKRETCRELAWNVVRGKFGCAVHNEHNYAYYARIIENLKSSLNTTTHTLVFRSEHLVEDWDKLELLFGGGNGTAGRTIFNTTLNESKGKSDLSPEGLQNLCRALCHEIQVYKSIILEAENLDASQRSDSLEEVKSLCPEETSEIRQCPPSYERE